MLEILPPFQNELRASKYGHGHLVTCCSEFYVISIGLKLNTTKRQCPYLEVHRSFWNRGSISHNTFTFTLEWSKGNYGQVEQAGYSLSNFMYCTYIEVSCSCQLTEVVLFIKMIFEKDAPRKLFFWPVSCIDFERQKTFSMPFLILGSCKGFPVFSFSIFSWFLVHVKVFWFILSRCFSWFLCLVKVFCFFFFYILIFLGHFSFRAFSLDSSCFLFL